MQSLIKIKRVQDSFEFSYIVLGIFIFGARVRKRGNCAEGSHENPTKVKFILKTNVFWSFCLDL